MGKTYRRPAIKQHRELEEAKYRARVEQDKKDLQNKKPKHPVRDFEFAWGEDLQPQEDKGE